MGKIKLLKILKLFCLALFFLMSIVACKKTETTASQNSDIITDTLEQSNAILDSALNKTNRSADPTFEESTREEYTNHKDDYDKLFDKTALARINYRISAKSLEDEVKKYKTTKTYLDIYFVLDDKGNRTLVLKFTNEAGPGPNYKLNGDDVQFLLNNGKLAIKDQSYDLEKYVTAFQTKYGEESKFLANGKHTIVIRDKVSDIKILSEDLVLEESLNSDKKASLTTQMNGKYFNRGALWP